MILVRDMDNIPADSCWHANKNAHCLGGDCQLPHVIAVTSGKGGVGKSSISVNVGIALARAGHRVCVFDADTGLANVNILLGLQPQYSLEHVIFGGKPIEDIILEGPYALKVIPGANGISDCVRLLPRHQLRLTRELAKIEGDFDFFLLDTAAGIADATLDYACSAHQVLLVITPEPTSLTDAFSMIRLLQRRRRLRYQVVVNMAGSANEAREVYHRFSAAVKTYLDVQTESLGFLLRDESLRAAVTLQSPVALFPLSDPSCRSFVRLADALLRAVPQQAPPYGFAAYWQRRYRLQRQAEPAADQAATVSEPVADDPGKLKEQLLALMEQPEVSAAALEDLLGAVYQAFLHRFGRLPIDPLTLIDWLAERPAPDTDLLQQMAQRIAAALPPPPKPAATAEISRSAPPPQLLSHLPTRYDKERFGSQQTLLELLRRHKETGESALTLIDALKRR